MNLSSINDTTDKVIAGLLDGTVKPQAATAIAGLIRQNISAHQLALDYAKAIGQKPNIPALASAVLPALEAPKTIPDAST